LEFNKEEAKVPCYAQLKRRFGELAPGCRRNYPKTNYVEKLEDLGEALLDFESQADLINWLNQA
jgi:hypothetical protein